MRGRAPRALIGSAFPPSSMVSPAPCVPSKRVPPAPRPRRFGSGQRGASPVMAAAAAAAAGASRGFWRRLGDTRLALWLRALLHDYSSSLRDAARSARRRPALAAASAAALALGAALARSVPDRGSLEAAAVAAGAALGQLPPGSRSPRAERHVQRLLRLRERGRLRVRSLGVIAIAGSEPHGSDPALYRARCPHLRERGELLDVGFAGRWWLLRAALRDSDINEEEFGHLPQRLRALRPRELRSERNERLHRERGGPVLLGGGDGEP